MPAATPVPRGPTVLTVYTAADLLTGPGCPVCRYAGEAADRYLAWFAMEGHADAATVTRLCASLGMCPRHTRGLMSQPGANRRLTALYRYLTRAARDRLTGAGHRAARPDGCPACAHDDRAAGRALETLLDGLTGRQVRNRYRELGGLCIPHLRTASAHGDHQLIDWLARTMTGTVTARPASPGWLAGTGHDADLRVALRTALPAASPPGAQPGSGACAVCLAVGRSEAGHLAQLAGDRGRPDRRLLLCPDHLGDLVVLTGQPAAPRLLTWQADCLAAALTGPASSPVRRPGSPGRWLRARRRARSGVDDCPVCLASEATARRAVDALRGGLRTDQPVSGRQLALGQSILRHPVPCVRHLLGLRAADPRAGRLTAPGAIERADRLIAELDEAFSKGTWAHRHEARGPEMTAWRRAAGFLDGGVFCGGPPV